MDGDARRFRDDILSEFFALMHDQEEDNYDAMRFSYDGRDRSRKAKPRAQKRYFDYFIEHVDGFARTEQMLADQASRDLLRRLILFRMLGHMHVRLPTNTEEYWDLQEEARQLPAQDSRLEYEGMFGPLQHFEVEHFGSKLLMDCWLINVLFSFYYRQYYLGRNGTTIQAEAGDHVIDAGACFGDTALGFASVVGAHGRVHAFDVLESHLEICRYNFDQNPQLTNIELHPFGLGERSSGSDAIAYDTGEVSPGFSLADSEGDLPVRSIDDLVSSGVVDRVDFIKMDIEGFELPALRGAEGTLRRFRPKLAISAYHRPADLVDIPAFLSSLGIGYRLYLDHYTIFGEETILYATASPSG